MSRNTNRQWWKQAGTEPRYTRYSSTADTLNQPTPHRPEERRDKIAKGVLHHIKASLPPGYMGDVGWRVSEWALVVTHPRRAAVVVGTVGDKTIDFKVSNSDAAFWMPGNNEEAKKEREASVLLSDTEFGIKSMAAIMKLANVVEVAKANRDDMLDRWRANKS